MAAALLLPTSASAATFYVRSSADDPSGSCPANDFTNSTTCTCRAAWNAANANPGSDTIRLSVDCFLHLIGIEDNHTAGDLDAWDFNSGTTLTIELEGHVITWLGSVDDLDKDRILHVPAETAFRRAVHLVVRDGRILAGRVGLQSEGGGCIAVRGASLTIDEARVEGCQLVAQGFEAGAPCGGGVEARGPLTITDSFIIQNQTTNASGGGVCAFADSTVTRTLFDGNRALTAGNGGGFALVQPTASLAFERVEIEDSIADTGQGGGLWSVGEKVTILESEIRWNRARFGGGVWLRVPSDQGSDPLLERSLLWANKADTGSAPRHGGGLYVEGGSTETTLVLYNSTLSRNEAGNHGGAMFLAPGSESYEVALRRCTVFQNTDSGFDDNVAWITGGSSAPLLTYTGSLLPGLCTGGGPTTSLGENLLRPASLHECDDDGSGEYYSLAFSLNPALQVDSGHGGFAQYHDIESFPPAWGQATCSTGEVDQADVSRSATCDIGAVAKF